ncbi:MAG: glucuronate isomerase [Spirochaetes bacterium]|uniref:Uronate isomerase n=1 Tax=Candidatus Ornithospirochaeta stercoravium TaxID=2840897 RepID=A0A9D9IEB0_9SPIO|nr:glucuronate isomerase [Candidatus Ornithospirochaeta stercoravium]
MKEFMDKDFLLESGMAKKLFHDHAADMPIFDYHCHLIPEQIATDKRFTTITDAWLGGDHYKWRQMRTCGFDEKLVTGDADPFDKFMAWAETMENLIGNPLYHWTHLELQRYFGIYDVLNRKNAKKIYDEANEQFKNNPELSVFGIMKKFKVYAVGTTDDPADDLKYHKIIRDEGKCPAKVIPSYRPDKALNIEKPDFAEYIAKLGAAAGIAIKKTADVVEALEKRLAFFVEMGCRASDHALMTCPHTFWSEECVNKVFEKRMGGEEVTKEESDAWRTYILTALARAYKKNNVAMQLHFAAIRDNNLTMYKLLGPDTGYDASYDENLAYGVAEFFKALSAENSVPKTIFYSLNPKDYYSLGTLMGCYQGDGIKGKIQLGSAWWFCDHRDGMEEQIKVLANLGCLPAFVGMLTDSRSFLSYSRHEYFRRILCNVIGGWADNGEVPNDEEMLGKIVSDISFNNAQKYFEG